MLMPQWATVLSSGNQPDNTINETMKMTYEMVRQFLMPPYKYAVQQAKKPPDVTMHFIAIHTYLVVTCFWQAALCQTEAVILFFVATFNQECRMEFYKNSCHTSSMSGILHQNTLMECELL